MCIPCPAGSSCLQKAVAVACAADEYSEQGEIHCHKCPVGAQWPDKTGYTLCTEGQYSGYGTTTCAACPVGHFCPDIFQDKQKCPPGTHQDATGKIGCKHCTIGYYSAYGAEDCTQCPQGSYCPRPDLPPVQCPFGTYSTAGQTICIRCSDGFLCEAGETSASPAGKACANGYVCNPQRQLVGFHHNIPCPPGYQHKAAGTKESYLTAWEDCPAGSYCPAGTDTAIACPKGHYCPLNTGFATEYPCPLGTYNGLLSKTQLSDCLTCPDYKYWPAGTETPIDCPVGSYWAAGTGEPEKTKCPDGTYSGDAAIKAVGEWTPWPAGFYCPRGSAYQIPCPPGTVNPNQNAKSIFECSVPTAGKRATIWGNSNADGDPCLEGHYCPIGGFGAPFPWPAGTFTDATNLVQSSDCTQCPQGKACEEGTGANVREKLNCAQGHYWPAGTKDPRENKWPAGTYGPTEGLTASGDCTPCTAGYYWLEGTVTPIYEWPKGYYCTAGTKTAYEHPCPAGTYNHITKLTASSEWFTCPTGHYWVEASTAPVVCPVGTYAPTTGFQAAHDVSTSDAIKGCLAWPAGQTCETAGTTATNVCGKGKYAFEGSTECFDCKIGHYCPNDSTSATQHEANVWPAGYLCPAKTTEDPTSVAAGDTYKCPKGYYCLAGATSATPCLAGTYNDQLAGTSAASCQPSPAGYYTKEASTTTGTLCTAGYYWEQGTTGEAAIPCPVGKMRTTAGGAQLSDCVKCTAGYYCGQATATPTICPQGSYCPEESSTPTQCPIGTFGASVGLAASTDCTDCLPGMFCSQKGLKSPDGLCDIGYYCIGKATTPNPTDGTTGNKCSKGGFCDLGSFESASCPPGTFNPDEGGTSEADCTACTPGKYCQGTNLEAVTGDCTAGYYWEAGSSIPTRATAQKGYYTEAGASEQTPWAKGKFNPYPAQSACLDCLEGYYWDETGMSENLKDCPTGRYCPAGTIDPVRCSIGYYNEKTNGIAVADCKPWLPGKYCNSEGLSASVGQWSAGYFCKTKSTLQAPETEDADGNFGPCPVGHYWPQGTAEPVPWPPGTYNSLTKKTQLSDCLDCSAGKYCKDSGNTADGPDWSAGYYWAAKSTQFKPPTAKCTAGNKCPTGSSAEVQCPAGTYQDQGEQADCIQWPAGFFWAAGATSYASNVCSAGHYWPAGTGSATENACPIGTYNPNTGKQASSDCKACKPGYYCATTGLSAPTNQWLKGYYCKSGATAGNPDSASETKFNKCVAGNYCPVGSAYQIPCKGGKAWPNNKMGDADLLDCEAGYYWPEGSTSTQQVVCPAGHYCLANSAVPTPCPRGTYSASTGLTLLSQCATCPVGKYCETAALTTPTGSCASGYFCKDTHNVERPETEECPPGYYCGVGSVDKTACSTGYQDERLKSSCKTCPAGFHCPATSTEYISKVMCDASADANLSEYWPDANRNKVSWGAGKYSVSMLSSTSNTDCQACPPGFFCTNAAGDAKFQACTQGYIWEEGSSASTGSAQCSSGFYWPAGYAVQVPCTPGSYCATAGLNAPTGTCTAGYYCKEGALTATPTDGTTGNKCPYGHYCEAGATLPTACPIGKYLDLTGQDAVGDCKDWTTGKICRDIGLVTPTEDCPEGYYCPFESGDQKKYPCPPGFRWPAGSNDKINCLSKTYQMYSNKGLWDDCPARYYCDKDDSNDAEILSEAKICPPGKYCPKKTKTPTDCPAGTYSAQGGLSLQSECENWPAGYYCSGGNAAPDGQCQAGYFCIGKASVANPTDVTTGNICPTGHYWPLGTYEPTPWPKGTVNDDTGDGASSDCEPCNAGFYCPYLGATSARIDFSSDTHKCDAGYHCKGGAYRPYGNDGTLVSECAIGKYWPKGSTAEVDWPLGTYNPITAGNFMVTSLY
jgi:hypothetical protein